MVYGAKAELALNRATEALLHTNPDLTVCIQRDRADGLSDAQCSRRAKVTLLDWSPFDHTAYLDADTTVYQDISAGFEMLADGFDLVLTASNNQGDELLWHVGKDDKATTLEAVRNCEPLQLQAGVLFVARNAHTEALWHAWRGEWERFGNQDQGALLRALARVPVRLWILGRAWNGGAIVGHHFGAC
ncbi:MAG: hypothetical protein WC455_18230 [Dehalococcoidia bacterium]